MSIEKKRILKIVFVLFLKLYASFSLQNTQCAVARSLLKSATGASGITPTAQGEGGVGEEEPRSDASSQVESEGSEPPLFYISVVLLCNVFFVAIIYFQFY
jgi:hypothetical protein